MNDKQRNAIIEELKVSYAMEIETVMNYIANGTWLDGIRAKHIKDALLADVAEELGHAQMLARRIKTLDGKIPGSKEVQFNQDSLQPPADSLDVVAVIKGVIDAEEGAINQYQKIIELAADVDPVTEDLCIQLKGDEEEHRRMFRGFLREKLEGSNA